MGGLFSLLLPLSITIDNVAIGQNTSLPPSRVAVISTVIHLTFLMVGVYLAPYITPYIPASEHWISPALFTLLGILSLWTVFHHTHQMVASVTGTLFLSSVLAFDALLLGLTPAVTKTLAFVFVGVFFFATFRMGWQNNIKKRGKNPSTIWLCRGRTFLWFGWLYNLNRPDITVASPDPKTYRP
ncbi:MAG: manganese efflux pump [Candidatus Puniceispirillaceae bacterium]